MKVSRRVDSVLRTLRSRWRRSIQKSMPSKQFNAMILMALISLHLKGNEIKQCTNQTKRKELISEFAKDKKVIENSIRQLWEQRVYCILPKQQEIDREVS